MVDPCKLVTHPSLPSLVRIRNWMIDYFQEDVLVQIDDDLTRLVAIRNGYATRSPEIIQDVLDNAIDITTDLGLGVFCFNRNARPMDYRPFDPIGLTNAPVGSTFGMLGPARTRKFNDEYTGRADLQFTLKTLQEDRILYCDRRFYFDHGRIFTGRGGNVGLVTTQQAERTQALLERNWGAYVAIGYSKSASFRIDVPRRQSGF